MLLLLFRMVKLINQPRLRLLKSLHIDSFHHTCTDCCLSVLSQDPQQARACMAASPTTRPSSSRRTHTHNQFFRYIVPSLTSDDDRCPGFLAETEDLLLDLPRELFPKLSDALLERLRRKLLGVEQRPCSTRYSASCEITFHPKMSTTSMYCNNMLLPRVHARRYYT